MGRIEFGALTAAWKGEAADFTPLLAARLDQLGEAVGLPLAQVGRAEVATAGGRRIDIVAEDADGATFVIENQYGRGDHDHLTRGLAYAVASEARGLIVVAEEHRDEFRAVARYLNDLAEKDIEHGIAVWLVEARAVRVDDSIWAPMFTAVVEPNTFIRAVEKAKQDSPPALRSREEFLALHEDTVQRELANDLVDWWVAEGHRVRYGPNHVVLEARGPSSNGFRTVVVVYPDGRVGVPFGSYAGQNTGISIEPLTRPDFRATADAMFGFGGTEKWGTTSSGWLTSSRLDGLKSFCSRVASAYSEANAQAQLEKTP